MLVRDRAGPQFEAALTISRQRELNLVPACQKQHVKPAETQHPRRASTQTHVPSTLPSPSSQQNSAPPLDNLTCQQKHTTYFTIGARSNKHIRVSECVAQALRHISLVKSYRAMPLTNRSSRCAVSLTTSQSNLAGQSFCAYCSAISLGTLPEQLLCAISLGDFSEQFPRAISLRVISLLQSPGQSTLAIALGNLVAEPLWAAL